MQLLANARAGDLEWGDNSVTYTPHYPIGLTLRDNTSDWNLYLKNAHNSINLAAADDKTAFKIYLDRHNLAGGLDKDITLTAAAGIKVPYQIFAKNLTLRGGNGDIDVDNWQPNTSSNYLDVMTGGNLNINWYSNTSDAYPVYVRNAIAGGDLKIYSNNSFRLLRDDNSDGYISAGNGREIDINCRAFGFENSWKNYSPYILANGAYLTINSKDNTHFTLNGITRDGLVNKIYVRKLHGRPSYTDNIYNSNVFLSPYRWQK